MDDNGFDDLLTKPRTLQETIERIAQSQASIQKSLSDMKTESEKSLRSKFDGSVKLPSRRKNSRKRGYGRSKSTGRIRYLSNRKSGDYMKPTNAALRMKRTKSPAVNENRMSFGMVKYGRKKKKKRRISAPRPRPKSPAKRIDVEVPHKTIRDCPVVMGFDTISLQGNGITSLEGLGVRKELKILYFQNNYLTSLRYLGSQPLLEFLHVSNNCIFSFYGFLKQPRLKVINLGGNPISKHPHYRLMVLMCAGNSLKMIDGEQVQIKEREFVRQYCRINPLAVEAVRSGWLMDLKVRTKEEFEDLINGLKRIDMDDRRTLNDNEEFKKLISGGIKSEGMIESYLKPSYVPSFDNINNHNHKNYNNDRRIRRRRVSGSTYNTGNNTQKNNNKVKRNHYLRRSMSLGSRSSSTTTPTTTTTTTTPVFGGKGRGINNTALRKKTSQVEKLKGELEKTKKQLREAKKQTSKSKESSLRLNDMLIFHQVIVRGFSLMASNTGGFGTKILIFLFTDYFQIINSSNNRMISQIPFYKIARTSLLMDKYDVFRFHILLQDKSTMDLLTKEKQSSLSLYKVFHMFTQHATHKRKNSNQKEGEGGPKKKKKKQKKQKIVGISDNDNVKMIQKKKKKKKKKKKIINNEEGDVSTTTTTRARTPPRQSSSSLSDDHQNLLSNARSAKKLKKQREELSSSPVKDEAVVDLKEKKEEYEVEKVRMEDLETKIRQIQDELEVRKKKQVKDLLKGEQQQQQQQQSLVHDVKVKEEEEEEDIGATKEDDGLDYFKEAEEAEKRANEARKRLEDLERKSREEEEQEDELERKRKIKQQQQQQQQRKKEEEEEQERRRRLERVRLKEQEEKKEKEDEIGRLNRHRLQKKKEAREAREARLQSGSFFEGEMRREISGDGGDDDSSGKKGMVLERTPMTIVFKEDHLLINSSRIVYFRDIMQMDKFESEVVERLRQPPGDGDDNDDDGDDENKKVVGTRFEMDLSCLEEGEKENWLIYGYADLFEEVLCERVQKYIDEDDDDDEEEEEEGEGDDDDDDDDDDDIRNAEEHAKRVLGILSSESTTE